MHRTPTGPEGAPAATGTDTAGIHLRLLLTMFFWGGTFVAARVAGRGATPFTAALLRFAVASAALFALLARVPRGARLPRGRQWRDVAGLGLTGIFLYNASFFTGLRLTTAANGSLIVALNPLVTALLAALVLGQPLRRTQAAGFALSLAGTVVLVSHGSWEALRHLRFNPGDLILLAAPLCWAGYTVLGARAMERMHPFTAVTWAAAAGTAMLLPAAAAERLLVRTPLALGPAFWLAILQLALLGTVAGFVWWYEGVRAIGPTRSALYVNLVPLFAILQAALFLGERLDAAQAAGGALVLAGVALGRRAPRP